MAENLVVAVITGQAWLRCAHFHRLFRTFDGIDAYVQNLEDFVTADAGIRDQYDALVFYNFHQATPTGEEQGWQKGIKPALEQLGQNGARDRSAASCLARLIDSGRCGRRWWGSPIVVLAFTMTRPCMWRLRIGCIPSRRGWGLGIWSTRRIRSTSPVRATTSC